MSNMSVKVKISGIPQLQARFRALPEEVQIGAKEAVWIIILLIRNRAIAKIKGGSKSGRIYRRGQIVHQASAPGQSPATDTGTLVRSAKTEVEEAPEEITGTASFLANYAKHLEFGTRNMAPRPFFGAALDSVRAEIVPAFVKSIKARLRK